MIFSGVIFKLGDGKYTFCDKCGQQIGPSLGASYALHLATGHRYCDACRKEHVSNMKEG